MASADGKTNRFKPTPLKTPSCLQAGLHFRRWDVEDGEGPFAHHEVKVDRTGLVLSILSDINEGVPIYLSEVSDVRCGKYARQPKDQKLIHSLSSTAGVSSFDDIAVTIVYGTNTVDTSFLNLAAISKGDVSLFVDSVRSLLNNVVGYNVSEEIMLQREYARLFTLRNPGKDGISVKHFHSMFALRPKDELQLAMSNRGWSSSPKEFVPCSQFNLHAFYKLYDNLVPTAYTADVIERMRDTKSPKPYVTVKEFCKFLNESHRDPQLNEVLFKYLKEDEVQQLVDTMEPQKEYAEKKQITAEGVRNFLRSKENTVIHLSRFARHQNMDQPLCHYFINSSHNTYLTGHQLTGKATVEIYRQVLLTGCRCIELDCWDGSDGEPIITHGNTLVNNIPFKDVIEAINECAFRASDYPVILSFENHCRFRQQRRMVQHLRNILGDKLMEPLLDYPLVPGACLPSPNQLRGKIICKNKLLLPKQEKIKDDDGNSMAGERRQSKPAVFEDDVHRTPMKGQGGCQADATLAENELVCGPRGERRCSDDPSRQLALTLMVPGGGDGDSASLTGPDNSLDASMPSMYASSWCELDMASLVNYLEPVKFKSFEESEERNKHYQMSSFAETQAIRLVLDSSVDFVKYTRRQNTRIYPRGTRVDSSNYQPQVFWNVGCQMVSLNFQTLDLPMQLNLGKFDYNGMCGYLLKPEVMRRPDRDFDPFAESPIDNVVAATVKVTVIAAHMISTAKDQIRVEVDMYGIPADTVRRKFRTKYAQNDTTVYFRSPSFDFKKVVLADHAMMRFGVLDSQGILLGMRVLPLDGLEPGYRYIHLHNDNNQPLPLASLFVFIELSEYIPKEMHDFAMGLTNPVQYQKERHQQALSNMMDDDPLLNEVTPLSQMARRSTNSSAILPKHLEQQQQQQQQQSTPTTAPPTASFVDSNVLRPRMSSSFSAGSGVSLPLSRTRKSVYTSKSSGSARHCPHDIIDGRDSQKMLGKINKEISVIRKKFLKTQASFNKTQASEIKKSAARGGIEQRMKDKHSAEMSKLVQKCLGDEEAVLLKQLPPFFGWVTKTLTSGHAVDLKRLESTHKKNLATLICGNQKENAQKSHHYKEEQKRTVADKEELQRKIREYSNKLVESAVEVRSNTLFQQSRDLETLETGQQEALQNLKSAEGAELERVRKLYASRQRLLSSSEGVQEYMSMALADPAFVLRSVVEVPQ